MGFSFFKSIPIVKNLVRVNISTKGIGMSVGVKGARISTGPRGVQLNVGRGGLRYRKTLVSPQSPALQVTVQPVPTQVRQAKSPFQEIVQAVIALMVFLVVGIVVCAVLLAVFSPRKVQTVPSPAIRVTIYAPIATPPVRVN